MTGIEGIGWPRAPRLAKRAAGTPGFFVLPDRIGTGQAGAASAPQATESRAMLTLQELGGETVADGEARRHGRDMLAALTDLQRALLAGNESQATMRRLSELLASVPLASDRRLAAMMSAIVVRVRVELARRENVGMSGC